MNPGRAAFEVYGRIPGRARRDLPYAIQFNAGLVKSRSSYVRQVNAGSVKPDPYTMQVLVFLWIEQQTMIGRWKHDECIAHYTKLHAFKV